jgi:multiple sugar transport system permease protein
VSTIPAGETPRPPRRRAPARKILAIGLQHAILVLASLAFLVPFYWMLISSLKNNTEIFARPIAWFPNPVRWENYADTWTYDGFPYLRLLWNSIYYSVLTTIGTVLSSAIVGYGFARFRFPGRGILFGITIATMIIPGVVTFIPTYILFKNMGLLGSYAPLIAPAFFGSAFNIFLMRQFFLGLPQDMPDSARLDGANEFRIFWEIMLPLVKPALVVVAVFTILGTWNEFFGPLIYLSDRDSYPLSLGLFSFRAQRSTEWAMLMSASVLVTIPMILMFAVSQKYFVSGIKMTGIK